MFGLSPATKVYLAVGATDLRKSFEGLHGLVRDRLAFEPLSGHLFLFSNQDRNRLKVLFWDGSGLWVCAKRLERGRFSWPDPEASSGCVTLSHEEFALLIGGIDSEANPAKKLVSKGGLKRRKKAEKTLLKARHFC
jgi:transposase